MLRPLQRRYDLVRNFSADFTQTYEGGMLLVNPAATDGSRLARQPP